MRADTCHCIPAPCKQWCCVDCSPWLAWKLATKLARLPATRFFTLTQIPREGETRPEAFRRISRSWDIMRRRLERYHGQHPFYWAKVVEVTQQGEPHLHILYAGDYIPQPWLSEQWRAISGAYIVDIREVKGEKDIKRYLSKYLSKSEGFPPGIRHYSVCKEWSNLLAETETDEDDGEGGWTYSPLSYQATKDSYEASGAICAESEEYGFLALAEDSPLAPLLADCTPEERLYYLEFLVGPGEDIIEETAREEARMSGPPAGGGYLDKYPRMRRRRPHEALIRYRLIHTPAGDVTAREFLFGRHLDQVDVSFAGEPDALAALERNLEDDGEPFPSELTDGVG